MTGTPGEVKTAYFGTGCFYGAECIWARQVGVIATATGFMGGATANPSYKDVCNGETGHAEVVRVTYDSNRTTYEYLLSLFWSIPDHPTRRSWQRRSGEVVVPEATYEGAADLRGAAPFPAVFAGAQTLSELRYECMSTELILYLKKKGVIHG